LAEDSGQEKTEDATQRRREDTRKRGQVARSTEINSAGMLLVGFTSLLLFSDHIVSGLEEVIVWSFQSLQGTAITAENVTMLFHTILWRFFMILLPLFAVMAVAAILVNIFQIGFLFTGEPLVPDLNKMNPLQGFGRIFSRRSAETMVRDIFKVILVSSLGYSAVKKILPRIMEVSSYSIGQILAFTGSSVFSIAMKILLGYIILAILDYGFQRWDYEKSMMMTRQEVREELKQTEGDPMLKARVRAVQREIARRRMMDEVPKAEVVITNPTEIAIAIAYEQGMMAPIVVAKGKRVIAERIRAIAKENGVPIVENVILAQALFKAVEIGNSIPAELFTAVAEVLAYVYKLKGKKLG